MAVASGCKYAICTSLQTDNHANTSTLHFKFHKLIINKTMFSIKKSKKISLDKSKTVKENDSPLI